jgi:hypothetical protein
MEERPCKATMSQQAFLSQEKSLPETNSSGAWISDFKSGI